MITEKWHGTGLELSEGEFFSFIRHALLPYTSDHLSSSYTPYQSEFALSTIELFSFQFVTSSALISLHTQLFNLLKQRLMLAQQQPHSLSPDHLSQCHRFLCYLSYSLAALAGSSHSQKGSELHLFSEAILSQLEAVFLLCGSISEVYRACNLLSSSTCSLSHTPLGISPFSRLLTDTKTHVLLASHLLTRLVAELQPRALQLTHSIWSELLALSVSLFLSLSDLLRLNFSAFPCSSLIELWCLSAALTERTLTSGDSGFWPTFLSSLFSFFSATATADRITSASERHQFIWWILLSVARVLPSWINTHNCWELCRDAISSLIALPHCTSLAFSLWTLLRLSQVWGGSMESAMLLWEGISKRMGESSHKQLSISDMSDLRYEIINTPQDVHSPLQLSTFELFLRFFSLQFSLVDLPPAECWKPYKGRFYSKLSARRLHNPSPDSVVNLYLLTFVLSYKTEVNDVADKSSEVLLKLVSNPSSLTPGTRQLVWEAMFGLLHVFVEKRVSARGYLSRFLPTLAEYHSAAMFDQSCAKREWEVCRMFWLHLPDLSSCRHQIEAVSEVLRELYSPYYSAFHAEHLNQILLSLKHILTGAYTLATEDASAKPYCSEISCFLWEFGYPHWRSDQLSHSDAQEMGNLIANLLLLSLASDCDLRTSISEVVKQLLLSDNLACPTGAHFIKIMLSDGVGRRYISQNQIISQLIIKAWLLYLIQSLRYPQFEPSFLSCSRELSALSLLQNTDTRHVNSMHVALEVMDSLFQLLSRSHQDLTASQFYFSDFLEWIEPLLCDQNTPKECLFALYRIASSLVRHCSSLIYSRTQPHCILPRLIEYLFLPSHSLAKPPHPSHLDCVRRHISSFLLSLCQLRPESDQFIQRKIRQLLSQYFPRFSQQAVDTHSCAVFTHKPNPFLSLFESCADCPEEDSADSEEVQTALYFLTLIRELFLKLPQQPSSLLPTLLFLQSVVSSASPVFSARAGEQLLFPMLGCLLACNVCPADREPARIRELSQSVIRNILTGVSSLAGNNRSNHTHKLVECVTRFVEVNLSSCHGMVFTTLKLVAQMSPEVITLSKPQFHTSLLALERQNPKLASEIRSELGRLESLINLSNQLH